MDLVRRILFSSLLNLIISGSMEVVFFNANSIEEPLILIGQVLVLISHVKIVVLEVSGEYCYYYYSYDYGYYYYECDYSVSGGSIAGAVIGTIIFIVVLVVIITICKNHNRTRVTTIRTPHSVGTSVITQQQQHQAPQPMMYGQYPQPGGPMYNQPPAYPPPQPNYPPPPQGNYPPRY